MEKKQEQETAEFKPKRGNPAMKQSLTKSAARSMKCLPLAAARNGSTTR